MLSGQQPFPGVNVTSILYKLVHVDPIEPADLEMNGLVPQKWREVFHKALAKRPEGRYQTAGAFVQDLEYCLGSWFTGLGSEETLSLQMPALEARTATMPVPATTGVSDPGGPGEEPETLVLVSPEPAGSVATVVLTPSLEESVLHEGAVARGE
jgi:hypothetical protein